MRFHRLQSRGASIKHVVGLRDIDVHQSPRGPALRALAVREEPISLVLLSRHPEPEFTAMGNGQDCRVAGIQA